MRSLEQFQPLREHDGDLNDVTCICLGSGRFMRAVLVPVLRRCGHEVIVVQPRGDSFLKYLEKRLDSGVSDLSYEVDCVEFNGITTTSTETLYAVGSLRTDEGLQAFEALPSRMPNLRIIGVGVTEAGLKPGSDSMNHLALFLHHLSTLPKKMHKISIINTDNVPENGAAMKKGVLHSTYTASLSDEKKHTFLNWLEEDVVFHNTMVDRITSKRDDDECVPRTEPLPPKALVIEDLNGVLPDGLCHEKGVVIRNERGQIEVDHKLKLCIANAIHTAIVYAMALSGMSDTSAILKHPHISKYISLLYKYDLCSVFSSAQNGLADDVYEDWIKRLHHPSFGLSTFFICQNASQKLGIRLMPSIVATLAKNRQPSKLMAFAVACLLRFITPMEDSLRSSHSKPVYQGKMTISPNESVSDEVYGAGMRISFCDAIYEFMDGDGEVSETLRESGGVASALRTVLHASGAQDYQQFLTEVTIQYEKLDPVVEDGRDAIGKLHDLLQEFCNGPCPFHWISQCVETEIEHVQAIDLHTHLLPPSHGDLMLWGVDELLTYHYLVAEYFMTCNDITPEEFFLLSKKEQANRVWKGLFLERCPISEACQGVLKTLELLGCSQYIQKNASCLDFVREKLGRMKADEYSHMIFRNARVRYNVMTNIPYNIEEASHWRPAVKPYDEHYRSALRVDIFLKSDWEAVRKILQDDGLPPSLDGATTYLLSWVETMRPEYLMASTPHDFLLVEGEEDGTKNLLESVLIPIAERCNLPIALKIGARRGLNARLRSGGDGVVTMDLSFLGILCRKYPQVRFLATFLSRVNQHEACVLANKFSNLHLYGCWWYCNNPSIIEEMTTMRIEMLGTAFTAQHSDARVLDQLLYKWHHSRKVITEVLKKQYTKLREVWPVTQSEIERDVKRLFGGSYEDFMSKTL